MNKIEFPRTGVDGQTNTKDDIEKWYFKELYEELSKRIKKAIDNNTIKVNEKNIELNNDEKNVLIKLNDKERLRKVVLALPKDLEKWAEEWDKLKDVRKEFKKKLSSVFNYTGYRATILVELAKKLNVKSCPYCNMHYTLYVEDSYEKNDGLAKFQYDHFYDKSTYPMFSMSLYNLIPSCAICNHSKHVKKLSLAFNPYHSEISEQFRFELKNPDDFYKGVKIKDVIDIEIIASKNTDQSELDDYIDTYKIKTLYQRHGDIAQEIFDKVYEYPYYSKTDNFKFLGDRSEEYIERLWYGTYIDKKDISKRPMTKFILDLREQAQCVKKTNENI